MQPLLINNWVISKTLAPLYQRRTYLTALPPSLSLQWASIDRFDQFRFNWSACNVDVDNDADYDDNVDNHHQMAIRL
jgi:hypothetical protein